MDESGKLRIFDFTSLRREERVATPAAGEPPVAAPVVDLSDSLRFETPWVEARRDWLDAERVLGPGGAGDAGSAYKMLRAQVLRRLDRLGANTLAVVGAGAGAGKTLTAINLAIVIAAETARTALLVDFDLRNPSIHRRLGIVVKRGVEECLLDRLPVRDAMVKLSGYERLTVLPARSSVAISSELLADQVTGDLVQELRQRYLNRIIIFDLPPALAADDALVFSRHVQAGLLVVREGATRRDEVQRTLQLLDGLQFVGTALNASRTGLRAYY